MDTSTNTVMETIDSKPTIETPTIEHTTPNTTDSDTSTSSELSFAPAEPEQESLTSDTVSDEEGEEEDEEADGEEESEGEEEESSDSDLSEAVGAQKPEDFIHLYYRIPPMDCPLTFCHVATLFLAVILYAWVAAYQVEQFKRCCQC